MPTVWSLPSFTSSRSSLVMFTSPEAYSSASSEPVATRTSRVYPCAPSSITSIVTSSPAVTSPSSAVSSNTYVPASEKVAVVFNSLASSKATVPGPLTWLQVVVTSAGGFGSPSSATVPSSKTLLSGRKIVRSDPAFTAGGWLSELPSERVISPALGTAS